MIKMEIALFLVISFLAGMYFSAERKKTELHMVFGILLVAVMVNLVFDGITVYTVNRLDEVPLVLNNMVHRVFISSLVFITFLFYQYIAVLVEEETGKRRFMDLTARIFLAAALLGTVFLPVVYIETPEGNYSMGLFARVCYVAVSFYLILCGGVLFGNWKNLNRKKKTAIAAALFIEFIVAVLQGLHPTWLISGMGITLMTLAFYLTLENPDILRAEIVEQKMGMRYLKSQVNPHFLYNTIGTIKIKAQLNGDDEVAQLLRHLTDFFRLSVKIDRQMVTLDDEVELASAYMELMAARYPSIRCDIDVNPDLGMTEVPNFILQPVVENSFMHGLKNVGYAGEVVITADYSVRNPGFMEISVRDTGAGFAEGKKQIIDEMLNNCAGYDFDLSGNSIGILNVQKRIKLLCGKKAGLSYRENDDGGVTATILLPVERKKS